MRSVTKTAVLLTLGFSMACSDSTNTETSSEGLCSGCSQEQPDARDETIHLHHIHMNVADREGSTTFYERFLAADRIELNGVTEALYAAPALLLLDEHPAPVGTLPTALQHVGWGSADVSAWFAMARMGGVAPDTRGYTLFNTLDTPTVGEPAAEGESQFPTAPACFPKQDRFSYVYMLGPDDERIEVWSGADQRLNHVHFTTADVLATGSWYRRFLGIGGAPENPVADLFFVDDILFFFEAVGSAADYRPTDDHVLGHIAFSVTDLRAWLGRVGEQAIEIVAPPARVHGFESFFIRGPDGMLIELVQAAPHAALCPEPSATGPATGSGRTQ